MIDDIPAFWDCLSLFPGGKVAFLAAILLEQLVPRGKVVDCGEGEGLSFYLRLTECVLNEVGSESLTVLYFFGIVPMKAEYFILVEV